MIMEEIDPQALKQFVSNEDVRKDRERVIKVAPVEEGEEVKEEVRESQKNNSKKKLSVGEQFDYSFDT